MSSQERRQYYEDPEAASGSRVFYIGERNPLVYSKDNPDDLTDPMLTGGPKLVFVTKEEHEGADLLMTGHMGDVLGPTFLFSSRQASKGHFEDALKYIEEDYGQMGIVPRLKTNGQALQ
jgi:hypothetical protein